VIAVIRPRCRRIDLAEAVLQDGILVFVARPDVAMQDVVVMRVALAQLIQDWTRVRVLLRARCHAVDGNYVGVDLLIVAAYSDSDSSSVSRRRVAR
jgi:hypothetical protein